VLDEIDIDYALVAHPYTLLETVCRFRAGMPQCLARNVSVIVGAPLLPEFYALGFWRLGRLTRIVGARL